MAGGEEDYMGDVSQFLPPEIDQSSSKKWSSSKSVMPSSSNKKLKFQTWQEQIKPKFQNWQEQRKLKRERKQIDEDQQTMENIGSAIPESNVGFKLLKQMGYTPGMALGKEGSGISEPIGLEIRRGRAGLGKEDFKVEKIKRQKQNSETMKRKEEELMEDFGSRQKERWKGRRIIMNYRKAENVLGQLEGREFELGTKEDEDGKNEEKEEEEEEYTEQDLLDVLLKLRNEFHYCLFCGCRYESMEALLSDCPGIKEDEH